MSSYTKLSRSEKIDFLAQNHHLSPEEKHLLLESFKILTVADQFVEQTVSVFPIPLAVVPNVTINKKTYSIPIVTEETSIVAALLKTNLLLQRHKGVITAVSTPPILEGQIHFPKLQNSQFFFSSVSQHKDSWLTHINSTSMSLMSKRGGGLKDITVRLLKRPDGGFAGVIHLHVNVCDAMGANTVTQLCEYLRPFIEEKTGERALLSILSNYTESRFTTASVTFDDFDAGVGQKIAEASLIAEIDPYRAVTHNKGIINGIDALTIATGNDHRAVSASLHSFAAKEGRYRPLSAWMYENKRLTGVFKGPIPVGIVGGVTALHPFAKIALKMMLVTSSSELSNVIAAIGLLQNFAALHALTTDGLIKGHMNLHLNNMIMQADANVDERHELYLKLKQQLSLKKTIHMHDVVKVLDDLRKK